jgi:hypothetical protein
VLALCAIPQVFALGVVSVFEQVLESLPSEERSEIFNAYVRSIGEDPDAYRQDSAALESAAGKMSTTEELKPNAEGSDVQASSSFYKTTSFLMDLANAMLCINV